MKSWKVLFLICGILALTLLVWCGKSGSKDASRSVDTNLAFAVDTPQTSASAATTAGMTRFDAKPGSKVRIEGTSTLHDWQVEGKLIGGYMEVGSDFPIEPGATATLGKVTVKAEAFIPVRSLVSIEKDGKPYSTKMDDIMYEKLLSPSHPRILYRVGELVLKEVPKSKDLPYTFDSSGELVVAGVTNKISMPIKILPFGDKRLKVSGSIAIKMTHFGIQPPAPALVGGIIKTGDEVKLFFEWMVEQKAAVPAVDK